VIQSEAVEFRVFSSLVTDFRATFSPLISGKHLPGITNAARSGPDPQAPLRFIWATVPFDVGTDYAMWAPITVKQQMVPTSQRNRLPTSTGIRTVTGILRSHPDATLVELQAELENKTGLRVSTQHLWRVVKRLGFRLKKSHSTPKSGTRKRTASDAKSSSR
jgi:hypothetical protein